MWLHASFVKQKAMHFKKGCYNCAMPQISKIKLPSLDLGSETLGQRIARIRKERGYTQVELADKIGTIRYLISDYERDKRRPNYEMIIHLAIALEVTTDELLGLKLPKNTKSTKGPSIKILRRIKKIEALSPAHQKMILKNIDIFLKGIEAD